MVLTTKGIFDNALKYHIANAKNNGATAEEMAEIITHAAFYAGWPKSLGCFYFGEGSVWWGKYKRLRTGGMKIRGLRRSPKPKASRNTYRTKLM